MKYGIVYKYEHKITNKVYIGSTIQDFKIRIQQHLRTLREDEFHKELLINGNEIFEINIVEDKIPENRLIEREYYWFVYYKKTLKKEMYNLSVPAWKSRD